MPFDLTELLESSEAPRMQIDPAHVLARGRRRRLRRRIYGSAAALGAAAVLVPAAAAMRLDASPNPTPAAPPEQNCLLAGPRSWPADAHRGAHMAGTPWLDSGPSTGAMEIRVQVHTDTCEGLAVAVSKGAEGRGSGSMVAENVRGRPREAFWIVDATGGGLDRRGAPLPVTTTAVALLPAGQQICGVQGGPEAGVARGVSPSMSEPVTFPAGDRWQVSLATMSNMSNAHGATLRICSGTRVVATSLRPLNAITELVPPPTGSAVTYLTTAPDGTTTVTDGNGNMTTVGP